MVIFVLGNWAFEDDVKYIKLEVFWLISPFTSILLDIFLFEAFEPPPPAPMALFVMAGIAPHHSTCGHLPLYIPLLLLCLLINLRMQRHAKIVLFIKFLFFSDNHRYYNSGT